MCAEPVRITGAGRTDAGVHATGQVIDLRTTSGLGAQELERGVNALLPEDIAISGLEPAEESFHARFSATGRTYEYRIRSAARWRRAAPKEEPRPPAAGGGEPLWTRREHWYPGELDIGAMRAAAG